MFELIAPYVLLIAIVGVGCVLWAKWMVQRAANHVEARHRAAELIINEGEVPTPWIEKYRKRVTELRRAGGSEADIEAVADQARSSIGRELDRLVKYMETTRLVADEDTREVLIGGIHDRRDEWEDSGWRQFVDSSYTPRARR